MRTHLESDLRFGYVHLKRPSSQANVHSKQHERSGHRFALIFIKHGSGAAVLSSCGVSVSVEWFSDEV